MLKGVTISGADDHVEPGWLACMSYKYPFVEWGILHSVKRRGSPRYPSKVWLDALDMLRIHRRSMKLSAHLCGQMARDTLTGNPEWLFGLGSYERVQLNGYEPDGVSGFVEMVGEEQSVFSKMELMGGRVEFVLQVRQEDQLQQTASIVDGVNRNRLSTSIRVSALYDPSGGRGVEAFSWPVAPLGLKLGYAGGIKPSNLEQVLKDIGPVPHDYWVDMESGVRRSTGGGGPLVMDVPWDEFDPGLVTEVLEKASRFIG
jgi:hypothetical protein